MNLVFCENGLKPDGNVMMIWKMTIGRQLVKIIPDLGNYGLSCGKGIFFLCLLYHYFTNNQLFYLQARKVKNNTLLYFFA